MIDIKINQRTPGQALKKAREQKGFSIVDVATHLNIRQTIVRDLEEDRFDGKSQQEFVEKYLTEYANFLKLDADEILSSYNVLLEDLEKRREQKQKEYARIENQKFLKSMFKLLGFILILGSLLFFIGKYSINYFFADESKDVNNEAKEKLVVDSNDKNSSSNQLTDTSLDVSKEKNNSEDLNKEDNTQNLDKVEEINTQKLEKTEEVSTQNLDLTEEDNSYNLEKTEEEKQAEFAQMQQERLTNKISEKSKLQQIENNELSESKQTEVKEKLENKIDDQISKNDIVQESQNLNISSKNEDKNVELVEKTNSASNSNNGSLTNNEVAIDISKKLEEESVKTETNFSFIKQADNARDDLKSGQHNQDNENATKIDLTKSKDEVASNQLNNELNKKVEQDSDKKKYETNSASDGEVVKQNTDNQQNQNINQNTNNDTKILKMHNDGTVFVGSESKYSIRMEFDGACWVGIKNGEKDVVLLEKTYTTQKSAEISTTILPIKIKVGAPQNIRIFVNDQEVDLSKSVSGYPYKFEITKENN